MSASLLLVPRKVLGFILVFYSISYTWFQALASGCHLLEIWFSPSLFANDGRRPHFVGRCPFLGNTISYLAQIYHSRQLHSPSVAPLVLPLRQTNGLQSPLLRHRCSASLLLLYLAATVLPLIPHHDHPFDCPPKRRRETKTSTNLFRSSSAAPCRLSPSSDRRCHSFLIAGHRHCRCVAPASLLLSLSQNIEMVETLYL